MIKILHSADWHLDSPLGLKDPQQAKKLKEELGKIPDRIAALSKAHGCDLVLLSGDLFDGAASQGTLAKLKQTLQDMEVPVFITPGNHDFAAANSPWLSEVFPENVHIFKKSSMESVALPQLDCRIYGAGFQSMDCDGLLQNFKAEQTETYAIGILHGDPTQVNSHYCPITTAQVEASGLDYLALGHIHKGDSFRKGKTLCAWPGCPMGRGYDEEGEKGVLIVTLDQDASARFVPLDTPRFYDLEVEVGEDPQAALAEVLPPVGNENFYRVTFVGASEPFDVDALYDPKFPNLLLKDKTTPPVDIWLSADTDTFEGMYFNRLKAMMEGADEDTQRRIRLAARISRDILDGQEVVLP